LLLFFFLLCCVVLCFELLLQALVLCCFSFIYLFPFSSFFCLESFFLFTPSFLHFFLPRYFCLASPLSFGVLHFVYCLTRVVCCFTLMLATLLLFSIPCMQLLCISTYCFMPIVSNSPLVVLHFLSNIPFATPSPLSFHYLLFHVLLPIVCLVC
jgi:hypothetical protein